MLRLIDYTWDCGRMGTLNGRFVMDDTEWKRLNKMVEAGTKVYYGEVLGKHSEVCGPVLAEHLTVVTEDQAWLKKASELKIGLNTGFNPLEVYMTWLDECEGEAPWED